MPQTSEDPVFRPTAEASQTLKALNDLIEVVVGIHLRLQMLTEELHGHSDLSRACRGILQDLYRLGPRTVPQLARGRPVSRPNVLMLVKRLMAQGLAESTRNPDHRRSYLVRLTAQGTTLLEEMWRREQEVLTRLDLALSLPELQSATATLQQFRDGLEQFHVNNDVSRL